MLSGFSVANNENLIRANIWSQDLTRLFQDDLFAMKFVRTIDFPEGTTLNIPRLGRAEHSDFSEGQAIKYNKMDTGNFTFEIDQYKYSANAMTEKFKRDSFYSAEVLSAFVPSQHRVLMEAFEARVFNRANAGQTASDLNTINDAAHRWVAAGTSERVTIDDFARARYALKKAGVPLTNLVAVVDPTVAFVLETQANAVNLLSPMPKWGDMVHGGLTSGFMFRFNIMGFDVYESNYLPRDIAETVDGKSTTVGVANMFFSAAPGDTLPLVAAFRQMPTVYSEFNKDLQQTEYLTITEYGVKLYRPENMVIVLSDTDI